MGFHSVKLHGEAASADKEAAERFPAELKKVIDANGYNEKQIWNVDETGLWFKMPPSRSYIKNANGTRKPGTKLLKDRCTLLLGGNADGMKLKPLLIYKSNEPLAFKREKIVKSLIG